MHQCNTLSCWALVELSTPLPHPICRRALRRCTWRWISTTWSWRPCCYRRAQTTRRAQWCVAGGGVQGAGHWPPGLVAAGPWWHHHSTFRHELSDIKAIAGVLSTGKLVAKASHVGAWPGRRVSSSPAADFDSLPQTGAQAVNYAHDRDLKKLLLALRWYGTPAAGFGAVGRAGTGAAHMKGVKAAAQQVGWVAQPFMPCHSSIAQACPASTDAAASLSYCKRHLCPPPLPLWLQGAAESALWRAPSLETSAAEADAPLPQLAESPTPHAASAAAGSMVPQMRGGAVPPATPANSFNDAGTAAAAAAAATGDKSMVGAPAASMNDEQLMRKIKVRVCVCGGGVAMKVLGFIWQECRQCQCGCYTHLLPSILCCQNGFSRTSAHPSSPRPLRLHRANHPATQLQEALGMDEDAPLDVAAPEEGEAALADFLRMPASISIDARPQQARARRFPARACCGCGHRTHGG